MGIVTGVVLLVRRSQGHPVINGVRAVGLSAQ
jgi:hypothetical protein